MAQKPTKDPFAKPSGADRTVRLPRKDLGLEKDEPTQALQIGVPAAASTLRLKRDEISLEEPTTALKAGVPAAESTLRLKRDDLSFEEPTVALRPPLRTAMEVIDEATLVEITPTRPTVMVPDGTDIPSWEETTMVYTPPSSGHAEPTVKVHRTLEPPPAPVDPGDSMDDTFSNRSLPAQAAGAVAAPVASSIPKSVPEPEEDTLVLPDMHELDELPNAMRATMVMPVMEAPSTMEATTIIHVEPAPEPMDKTMVMSVMEAPLAMEATTIIHVEPAPEPMVMPVMEAPLAMEATTIIRVEPAPEPMDKTMVMPVMEAPLAMEATTIWPVQVDDSSAYLTRQGQAPLPLPGVLDEPSPGSTQLMSETHISKAIEATVNLSSPDSALAPVPPEVPTMEGGSPLLMANEVPLVARPILDPTVNLSGGMAVTPPTMLMPANPGLDPTVPVKRLAPTPLSVGPPKNAPLPPSPFATQPGKATGKGREEAIGDTALPSVPGYPDRSVALPIPVPSARTKPVLIPVPVSRQDSATPSSNASKLWIPVAIGVLLLAGGGIYFAFFRTSGKSASLISKTGAATLEPSLPVPTNMQGTLAKARSGDGKSMQMLGISFFYGLDVPQNKAEGLRWMRKAAAAGNEKAKSDLRQMEAESR